MAARLRRSNPNSAGITRHPSGRAWRYRCPDGSWTTEPRERGLVIPPAWTDVWICPDPMGHIQVVGTDQAGRRQYLYHSRWQDQRSGLKFERMLVFGAALPTLREQVSRDLRRRDLGPERVLATAVRMLDRGFFRMGSESYERNGTVGLVTLRREHVVVGPGPRVSFTYRAKHGIELQESLRDPSLRRVVSSLLQVKTRQKRLLVHEAAGRWVPVRSQEVNDYVRRAAGVDVTAKDFRTWSGTVIAAAELAEQGPQPTARAKAAAVRSAIAVASQHLGNTPAVARSSYVDPRVVDRYLRGLTMDPELARCDEQWFSPEGWSPAERGLLDLLAG